MTESRAPYLVPDSVDLAATTSAVHDFGQGRPVLLIDDGGPAVRGVLVAPAQAISTATVNFMAVHGRGVICAAMTAERLAALEIPMMAEDRPDDEDTRPYAVTVDARVGTTSGTSAADRALTLRVLAAPDTRPRDLSRPGHIMPIRTSAGGLLRHLGYAEAAVELARMAGLAPCCATCEVLGADGRLAGLPELTELAGGHGLTVVWLRKLTLRRIEAEGLSWDGTWPPGPGTEAVAVRGERSRPLASAGIPVRAISAVTVRVTDQERALDFYVGKLGFVKRRDNQYAPGVRWIEVGVPGSDAALALIADTGQRSAAGGPRFTDVILGTADIAAAYEALRAKGVEFRSPPTRQPWGSMYAELQDPDGNVFILVER